MRSFRRGKAPSPLGKGWDEGVLARDKINKRGNIMADQSNRTILYPTAPKLQRARELRKRQTPEEAKLWAVLRNRGLGEHKFKRQVPIGHFVVDFFCEESNLVIELDGDQHQAQEENDSERTIFLQNNGFRVIRFWNNDVMMSFSEVIVAIQAALKSMN
jgi:very-short-patch-repair endonuclease